MRMRDTVPVVLALLLGCGSPPPPPPEERPPEKPHPKTTAPTAARRIAPLPADDERFWFGTNGAPPPLGTRPAPATAAAAASATSSYVLEPSDVLDFRIPEYPGHDRQELVVGPDGKITLDLVGTVSVAGRTTDEVAADLSRGYANFLRRATPRLALKAPRPRDVVVVGPAPNPGRRRLGGQGTLLDVLGDAGFGTKPEHARASLSILRGGHALTIPAREVLALEDPRWNVVLHPDDIIVIHGEDSVLVSGEVRKPGVVLLPANGQLPLTHVLAQAGGATEDADLEHARIVRGDGTTEEVDLNRILFGDGLDPMLSAGDSLSLPASRQTRVWVFGMVEHPGLYRQAAPVRVLHALAHASPKQFGAVLGDTKLVRGWPEKPEVVTLDLEELLAKGDTRYDRELHDGDVLFVPESRTSNVLEFLQRALSPWSATISAGGNYAAVKAATNK